MRFRSLLTCTAALFAGGAMAEAADLPTPAPEQYVRICDAFGAGFYYLPGTDTCLLIGGRVRAEAHYVDGDIEEFFGLPGDEEFNNFTTRARGNIWLDARTASEIGLIRTYVEYEMTVGPDDFAVNYDGTDDSLSAAFVEVSNDAGIFTAGHNSSFFDFFSSDTYGTRIDIDDNTTEQTLFAYTYAATSGLRGTLSVEDPASSGRRLSGADAYEGQEMPDLVANVRIDKDWGSAQIMGAARHIHDSDGDGFGWAVGAGLSTTLPFMGLGFSAQAAYADGAIAYVTNDPGGLGDFGGPDGDDTNTAWTVRAGLTAPFSPTVSAWLDGSFTHVEDDNNDDEYDFWAVVGGAAWEPISGLAMGPEVGFNRIEGDDADEDGDVWGAMWRVESTF